jgi:signal transduction histidine kinase
MLFIEIKKMAKDDSPRLKETVRSLKPEEISPLCLQEALEIACQRAHVNAINAIILAGVKESLKLKDGIKITLKFNFVQVCYEYE